MEAFDNTILDNWDNMTDEEKKAALIESLDKVDRGTWECMAACVDVYQRKQAGTLGNNVSYAYY